VDRRNFIILGSAAAAVGYGIGKFLPKSSGDKFYLRPPGAVDDFDDLCVKCGQCVQVCPYHSISLLDIKDGYSNGSAYIDAKKRGCYLCDLFPCVLACPSGALDHATKVVGDVKMGVAVLSDTATCLSVKRENLSETSVKYMLERKAYNDREEAVKDKVKDKIGQICDLCVSICPVGDSAISMSETNLPLIKNGCVGCGVCAEVCPVKIINIVPKMSYDEIYKEKK
jgi:iron-sulfur protein